MDEKSLELLEFPKVLQILAGFTSFPVSREMALELKPSSSPELVSGLLTESRHARYLMSQMPGLSLGGVLDIRDFVKRAAVGQLMAPKDLLDVQCTLEAVRDLRTNLAKLKDDISSLWSYAEYIVPFPEIEDAINHCIGPRGDILDSASNKLFNIRFRLRETRQRLISRLESILEASWAKDLIQEHLIVERAGRYVIPLKVEMRKRIKGIVHDFSNTEATAFVEPWATVELGNELRELAAEEKQEMERILTALTIQVGDNEEAICRNIALAADIDLILAKAKYADNLMANEPLIEKDKRNSHKTRISLAGARHPLLRGHVVPLSVEIGDDFSVLVITGPNTGGKTVALKTIGLLVSMAQAGIHIPASEGSSISIFDDVFADIGDEQSIEQTLSTFSWHMTNINRIINRSTGRSLVLLDELATNTDPAEGAALGRAILHHFLSQSAMVVATTHYNELKLLANTIPGMQNASLDFDPVTLAPTYHLTMGLSGGSNAIDIAARLGLPPEIITSARNALESKDQEVEKLLASLRTERQVVVDLQSQAEKERTEAEKIKNELQDEVRAFQEEKQGLLQQAREDLQETRDSLYREADDLRKQISRAESQLKKVKSGEQIEQARQALTTWKEKMSTPAWQLSQDGLKKPVKEHNISVGDRVWLKDMYSPATVISLRESGHQIEVQVGKATLLVDIERVQRTDKSETKPSPQMPPQIPRKKVVPGVQKRNVSLELDLRGKKADAVSTELDRYINDAYLANLTHVRIVHGFGTGTLRQIVRDTLAYHPLVGSYRSGYKEEGGDGVTIAML